MLVHLSVRNFAVVDAIEVDLGAGATVVTGETGAGKSIMLDALGLALGDRADSRSIGTFADRTEVTAVFSTADCPDAAAWLAERELAGDDDTGEAECIVRRVIGKDGRSRAFVNGTPVGVSDLRDLGASLIDIHSQHEHQSLLKVPVQRRLLDAYAGAAGLATEVADTHARHAAISTRIAELEARRDDSDAELQLLAYQLGEFDALAPEAGELERLEAEQKSLQHAESHLADLDRVTRLGEAADGGPVEVIGALRARFAALAASDSRFEEVRLCLDGAAIQLDEAVRAARGIADGIEVDPGRLGEVSRRLDQFYDIARKHRVSPEEVAELGERLAARRAELESPEVQLDALRQDQAAAAAALEVAAGKLSKKRGTAARKLGKAVTTYLQDLGMPGGRFVAAIAAESSITAHGSENVSFLVTANPDREPGPLAQVASGGELSRISLALQVVLAGHARVPSLVFDEVDVGIGGATALTVGRLLQDLARRQQVICVTHLAQVAAHGDAHLNVTKVVGPAGKARGKSGKGKSGQARTTVALAELDATARTVEIARMLGGDPESDTSLAHAAELLAGAATPQARRAS